MNANLKQSRQHRFAVALIAALVAVVFIGQLTLAIFVTQAFRTNHLHDVYDQQYAAIGQPLLLLGITNNAQDNRSCGGVQTTHFSNRVSCFFVKNYPPNALLHPLSPAAQAAYPANAARLDSLLTANGWTNSSPLTNRQTVASLQTSVAHLPGNGNVVDLPLYKYIGAVKCELVISYGINNAVDGNYQCDQHFSYPGLHLLTKQYGI